MSRELKTLLKHGSVYTFGIILGRLVSFLMIPLYTNYLTAADYGVLQLLATTIDIVSTVFGVGLSTAMVRSFHQTEDEAEKRRVVSTALVGAVTLMGTVAGICLLFAPQFSQLLFHSPDNAYLFRIMFISMFLSSGIELPMVFLRVKLRSGRFVLISLLKTTVQLSLNIYFLVVLNQGVAGILYSTLISSLIFIAYLGITTFREVGFRFEFAKYRAMLSFGAPLIISDVSAFIMTYSSRYFLNYLADLTVVGLYSLAFNFGMVLSQLLNAPFMSIWGTEMFKYAKLPDGKAIFSKILNYYLLVALFVTLGLSLLTRDALRIMSKPEFWSAYKYVSLISISYILFGVMYIAGAGILIMGKSKYRAISTALAAVANLILNFVLIPPFGGFGAALAAVGSFLVRVVIDIYYSQKLFPVTYDLRRVVHMSVIFTVLLLAAIGVQIENLWLSILFNVGVVLLFPLLVYATGVLTAEEKYWARRLIKNPIAALGALRSRESVG